VPFISCIVPCHNGEAFLAAALDSILAQDHRPLEIIVIDDGSSDSSAEIAERYGEPVSVLRQERGGQARARNAGILAAAGGYICFLDADDLYRPGKLTAQLAELEAHPEVELCLCTAENFWEPGLEAERERYSAYGKLRATTHLGSVLARRSVFDSVGLLDPRRGAASDIDWFMRLADSGLSVHTIPEVLYLRRMHSETQAHRLGGLDSYLELAHDRIEQHRSRAKALGAPEG